MICLICRQSEIEAGLTSIVLERGEIKFVMQKVPALVCPRCGEASVDENVAAQLLHQAQEMSAAGIMHVVRDYEGWKP